MRRFHFHLKRGLGLGGYQSNHVSSTDDVMLSHHVFFFMFKPFSEGPLDGIEYVVIDKQP